MRNFASVEEAVDRWHELWVMQGVQVYVGDACPKNVRERIAERNSPEARAARAVEMEEIRRFLETA